MNRTGNSKSQEDNEISLLDILQVVAENARLLVFGPILAGLVALGISFLIKPTYTASTKILTPQQQQIGPTAALAQLSSLVGAVSAVSNVKNPIDLYVALTKSRTVSDRMVDRFKLLEVYDTKYREDARKTLVANSRTIAGKEGLITIEVDDHDPKRAAAMANAFVDELSVIAGNLAVTESQQRRKFFERELEKVKTKLAHAQAALGGSGVSENMLKFNPGAAGEGVASLKAQVAAKEVQLGSMRGYLTPNSPDFRQAQQELAALRSQLVKVEASHPSGSNAEYINRYRDYKYHEVLFDQLAKQYELAKIDEAREGAVMQVVDVAQPPERKSKPKKALIAILTTFATGFVLLLYVFVRRAIRNTYQNPDSAAKLNAVRSGFGQVLKQ